MIGLLINGIAILAGCWIFNIYNDNKVNYHLPRETWATQEYRIYNRQQLVKHLTTAGILLSTIGLIGVLLGH